GEVTISTSIGGIILQHGDHSNEDVLRRVDDALYQAKNDGRNCTVFESIGKLDPEDYKEEGRSFIE
ncbi:MAG: diguanylate cyclase, partial [Pseudomonadota bacterium]